MSALARIMLKRGLSVSGSDKSASPITDELEGLGAKIYIGHQSKNVQNAGAIVISTAIANDNPELATAQEKNLPIFHRSQILSFLASGSKLLSISGTHGKTTTTGMLAQILIEAGQDPTVVVGGVFKAIEANSCLGKGEYFIAEADESDGTHKEMSSYCSLITNIEADHLENYPGGINQIYDNMVSFANNSQYATFLCLDDPGCLNIKNRITNKLVTYAVHGTEGATYSYELLDGFKFAFYKSRSRLGEIDLAIPGDHNKANAAGAACIAMELGVKFEDIQNALKQFSGVGRRFDIVGEAGGILVVDDYAHHPTEVLATLKAARAFLKSSQNKYSGRLIALFQPHQPGRLRDLWTDFCQCFIPADKVLLADIYIARGEPIDGINSERFAQALKHPDVVYLSGNSQDLPKKVVEFLNKGDILLVMGAGDITSCCGPILKLLEKS